MPSLSAESHLVARSIVRVASKPAIGFGDERRSNRELSFGTGIVVGPRHVVTAGHVVGKSARDVRTVVFTHDWERESEISATILARHPVLDLALLEISEPINCKPLPWVRGNPGRHEFPSGVYFCAYGFPAESGGQSLCCQRLADKNPSFGFEIGTGKMVRVQLEKGLPHGYSGGPVMLHVRAQEACFGLARLGGGGAATSVIIPADEVLPFLAEQNLSVEAFAASDFIAGAINQIPTPRTSVPSVGIASVVEDADLNASRQTNISHVGRDVVITSGKEISIVGICIVALVALVIIALNILRLSSPAQTIDRTAERQRQEFLDTAAQVFQYLDKVEELSKWWHEEFLPLETNELGKLNASQSNFVARTAVLDNNNPPENRQIIGSRRALSNDVNVLQQRAGIDPTYLPTTSMNDTLERARKFALSNLERLNRLHDESMSIVVRTVDRRQSAGKTILGPIETPATSPQGNRLSTSLDVISAAKEQILLKTMVSNALNIVGELEQQLDWYSYSFIPIGTNFQGRLIASQPGLVTSIGPLLTNQIASQSKVAEIRLGLVKALTELNIAEINPIGGRPSQEIDASILKYSHLAEEALRPIKALRERVETIFAIAQKINQPSQTNLLEAIELAKLKPPVLESSGTTGAPLPPNSPVSWVTEGKHAVFQQDIQKGILTESDGSALSFSLSYTLGDKVKILEISSKRVKIRSDKPGSIDGWLKKDLIDVYLKPVN